MRVSYLVRHRSGSLYFRYIIPLGLRRLLGREVRLSLGIALRTEALPVAALLASKTNQIISQVRSMDVSLIPESKLRKLVRDLLKKEMLEEYHAHRSRQKALTADGVESLVKEVSGVQEDCREALCRGDYAMGVKAARELLQEHGFDGDMVEENLAPCARAIMQEREHYVEFVKDLYTNPNFAVNNINGYFSTEDQSCREREKSYETHGGRGSITVGDAIASYVEYKSGCKAWNKKSVIANKIMFDRFMNFDCGGNLIADIFVSDLGRDIISQYVVFMFGEKLSLKTINNNFVTIKTFVIWCESEGLLDNATRINKKFKLSAKQNKLLKKKSRTSFTLDEVSVLLNSLDYCADRHKQAAWHWAPLIGLFSGARLGEILQLELNDIRKVDGIFCFDINDDGEKSVKTASSKRIIPIHPLLLEFGLVNRVESLRKLGFNELFPMVLASPKTGMKGDSVSKWFTRYRRKCGVKDKDDKGLNRVFHSLRHTVVTRLRAEKVDETLVQALIGHEQTRSVTDGYDSNEVSVSDLLNSAVMKLDFGCLPVDVLSRSKWIDLP